ncbi:MAG: hypothetical protein H7Y37_12840 [Anaerolineae bacterium]|nr:hypothetical protein [Gloeobacterales cyanobacterium ES-bin-313]
MEHPTLVSMLLRSVFKRSSTLSQGANSRQAYAFCELSCPLSQDDLEAIVGGIEIVPGSLPRKQQPE